MSFLEQLAEITARVRRGETLPQDELAALKLENRRRADEAEAREDHFCDYLPPWINTSNTTICNLECIFCDQAYGKTVKLRMKNDVYQSVVEELYPAAQTVQLSAYGEPMMTPNIARTIEDMERFGVKLEMVTNATLMKGEELVARIARTAGYIRVSIDGATPETYNNLRVGADFDQVIGNIRLYNRFRHELPEAQRAPLGFHYILMKRTLDELIPFLELCADLDAQHVIVSHLVVFEDVMREEMIGSDPSWHSRANDVLEQASARAQELGLQVQLPPPFQVADLIVPQAPKPEPIPCWFLWQRVYVTPHGDIVPCCLSGMHNTGSLKNSSFAAEWNSPLYQDMRRKVNTDDPYAPCKTCYLVNRSPDTGQFDHADEPERPVEASELAD